jgi:hypothetical protein
MPCFRYNGYIERDLRFRCNGDIECALCFRRNDDIERDLRFRYNGDIKRDLCFRYNGDIERAFVSDIMVISTYISFPITARIYAESHQSFQQFSIPRSDDTITVQLCVCVSVVFPWNARLSVCRAAYCLGGLSVT